MLAHASPADAAPTIGNLKNIGHQVITLNDQILNDGVNHGIAVFDARNRHIANILKDGRDDDLAQVLDEVWLKGWLAILVIAQVIEELLQRQGKLLVLRVLVELLAQEAKLIHDAVRVIAVTVAQQKVATLVELVPLVHGTVLHDVALLLEALANVGIDAREPGLELGVLVGVLVDLVQGGKEILTRGIVGEALNQSLEFGQHGLVARDKSWKYLQVSFSLLKGCIGVSTFDGAGSGLTQGAGVTGVCFGHVEQSIDGLHVCGRVLVEFPQHGRHNLQSG